MKKLSKLIFVVLFAISCTAAACRQSVTNQEKTCETTELAEQGTGEKKSLEQNQSAAEKKSFEQKQSADQKKNPASGQTETISDSFTVVMVGDVLLHTPVSESGKYEDGTYCYDHLFAHVKDTVSEADAAIVNEEVILGGTELGLSGYPCFNGAYEVGDALVNAGFDVVLHATNHALDKGEKGVRNCLQYWQTSHPQIKVVGINASLEEQKESFALIEKNGFKIAVLNYTYGTNGIELPQTAPYLVNLIDEEKIAADVAQAKEQADFIIVCPHWGIEYQHKECEAQEKLASFLADLGVNLVIGTHPHVIQPIKWVEGKNGNQTLVYYSLGNFVNATSGTGQGVADRMLGAMACVKLKRNADNEIEIASYDAIPLVSHLKSGVEGITVYPLQEYPQELAEQNEIMKQDSSFSTEYLWNVFHEVMGEKYPLQ